MPDLLVDTDVFIDHLRGHRRLEAMGGAVHYSVVTRCELYAGRSSDEDRIDTLLEPFMELGVDRQIATRAGRLRRDLPIRMPDALVAATALERNLTLLTRNRKDFESVPGLTVQTP